MSDENVLDGYTIGFDPAHGEDKPCLQILRKPEDPGDEIAVIHSSYTWETTAAHLAVAMAEIKHLRADVGNAVKEIFEERKDDECWYLDEGGEVLASYCDGANNCPSHCPLQRLVDIAQAAKEKL